MDEERRVTSTRKPKKIVKALLIIVAILGIALIGVAVYFYTIGDTSDTGKNKQTKTCGCYYIDPSVISECTDPRRGFLFETLTVPSDQNCKAACATNKLSTNLLKSSTQQDLYQICQLQSIQDNRCNDMIIKDKNGKIVTGKISSTDEVTIEAKFDKEYKEYQFVINNEPVEPDIISPDKLTIKKTLKDFTTGSLNIVATGKDSNNEQINSPICRRLIEISQEGVANVNEMQILTQIENKVFKISRIKVSVGNVKDSDKLNLSFTFSNNFSPLTMQKGFTYDSAKGEITILGQDLYKKDNFGNTSSFEQLNKHEGELKITVEVKDNGVSLGSTFGTVTYPTEEALESGDTQQATTEESNFEVRKTSSEQCVERVSPDNRTVFTLTIINKSSKTQGVVSVKDKLPLGFNYVAGSTKINNASVKDSDYVKSTTVGDSKEIVWSKNENWSISSNQSLIISFEAAIGSNALTGNNQNEVIVTPVEIPKDPSKLRAQYVINVQQDCNNPTSTPENPSTPQTGIFDSTLGRVLLGLIIVVAGWYIYNKPLGRILVDKILTSGIYKEFEMFGYKVFKPKKYFEEKVVEKIKKSKV